MRLIVLIALAATTLVGIWGTSAVGEHAHDSEVFAAYCIGVFGADQTGLKSPFVPACMANEPADECSARIAEIDQERHHVDLTLRGLQGSLARQGIIAPERYTRLARYLVAASCWEGL
jgi:hypothetical protein